MPYRILTLSGVLLVLAGCATSGTRSSARAASSATCAALARQHAALAEQVNFPNSRAPAVAKPPGKAPGLSAEGRMAAIDAQASAKGCPPFLPG